MARTSPSDVPVPVSFGFHPYLLLPGVPRAEWQVAVPVRRRLDLDELAGLRKIIKRTVTQRRNGRLERRLSRQHDRFSVRESRSPLPENGHAANRVTGVIFDEQRPSLRENRIRARGLEKRSATGADGPVEFYIRRIEQLRAGTPSLNWSTSRV